MGTGYVRNDSANNIADGNVINAADLDGEFDAVQAAFNASTGHSHDGTTGEGPQITSAGLATGAVTSASIANDSVALGTKTTGNYVAAGAVSGVGLSGSASAEGATFTVTSNATDANTASTIVARDASGNFSAGTITADLTGNVTGNADTATNAADSALLDGIDSTSFLRSDAADTKTSGDLSFSDSVKAIFGAGSDLQIYHDGSHSYIQEAGTGNLTLKGTNVVIDDGGGNRLATFVNAGRVDLNYSGATKLATTSTGVDITGTATMDGLSLGDSQAANFGASSDLRIYHDGSASIVYDNGTGPLNLQTNNSNINIKGGGSASDTMAIFKSTEGVDLYYNNVKKFETTSTGVSVTGDVITSGKVGLDTSDYITWSNNSHTSFFVNGGEEARLESDGDFHADGDIIAFSTTISDERLKTDIEKIDSALDKVGQLNGYTFTYKADGKQSAGVIAQEVEKVFPSAVSEKELPLKMDDGVAYKTVQYDQLVGLLIEAVNELQTKVAKLEGK